MAINSLSASSYGLSGLVSGMDTQSMVEKMLSGTQSKIDRALQQKSVLQYKQSMYRDVATQLRALQSSFMSFTSGTNLMSNAFFNTMQASVTPPANTTAAFSVSASSSAQVGNYTMQYIEKLATAYSEKTNSKATAGVSGTLSQDAASRLLDQYRGAGSTLRVQVGGASVYISDAMYELGSKAPSDVASAINDALAAQGIDATASFRNNKLEITASDSSQYVKVSAYGSSSAKNSVMAMFGGSSEISGKGKLTTEIDTAKLLPGFDVNLDGQQKTIRMSLQALETFVESGDASQLETELKANLSKAFGVGVGVDLQVDGDGNSSFVFTAGQNSQRFTVTGSLQTMGALGMKSGISNKLNTSMALKDLNFAGQLQGSQYTFSINGTEFSFSENASLSTVINAINNSDAGVKVSYIESEDRFLIQNAQTGAVANDFSFDIKNTEGNLMSVLFGAAGGSTATGSSVHQVIKGTPVNEIAISGGGTYTFNVNGKDYKFELKKESYTLESFAKAINDGFKSTFGVMADGRSSIEFRLEDDGSFAIEAHNTAYTVKTVDVNTTTNVDSLGFKTGVSTLVDDGRIKLNEAGINFGTGGGISIKIGGTDYTVAGDLNNMSFDELATTMGNVIKDYMRGVNATTPGTYTDEQIAKAGVQFDEKNASFRVMGVDIPMEIVVTEGTGGENTDRIFGQSTLSLGQPATGVALAKETDGQNAVFKLNGQEMERASNTFTIDGLTFTLNSTTHVNQNDPDNSTHTGPTTISVTRDTEKIVEGIEEFLKMYNETMDSIYDLLKADATYKDYAPLSDAQKAEMSDREIELWEEKAKEGLLRNDPILDRIVQNMRSAMYSRVEGFAIYDLGISTSYYTKDGNLNVTSSQDLRAAIEADPDAVRKLFAGEGGLMEQLNAVLDQATRSSSANPGSLVAVAGTSTLDTSSSIYKQIKELDSQMTSLESRYWNEYDRYWSQFNAMEQMIAQMNQQSSWLSQQISG